jgi:two-component system chemotaxis response regulator CheB
MAKRNIIVIGASAGGFDAIKRLVSQLPPNLDASIFIVWHMSAGIRGILPDVLNRLNTIAASNARDKENIESNHIYVAPPDHHLLIEANRLRVIKSPKENRFRPAINPLFRSAAQTYGNRVIGVILSGALDDGTAGLWRVKFDGGISIVQDPADAEVPSMPESAMAEVQIDHCVAIAQLASLLVQLSAEEVSSGIGSLRHAYSADARTLALSEKIEDNLYNAVRSLEENMVLLNDLGDHYSETNQPKIAAVYFKKAKESKEKLRLLLSVV